MKRLFAILTLIFLFISPMYADHARKHSLDQISFQLQAEDWAATSSAEVTVSMDAILNSNQLAFSHQDIQQKLQKISSDATWHITNYYRSKDQSGLEKLTVLATARLPESKLADLRDQAKNISRAGETYRIQEIAFVPSLSDLEMVREKLRDTIYQQAKAETDRLNKIYPEQHYAIHLIQFDGVNIQPQPVQRNMAFAAEMVQKPASLQVSQKIQTVALVVLASRKDNEYRGKGVPVPAPT